MKSFFRFLLFISLSFVLVVNTFAIDAPINIEIESYTDNSVVITWEKAPNALMYYVYYWTESWIDGSYEQESDFIEWNSVEITDLIEWTDYYFTVTSLDENGEESSFSEEIVFDSNNMDISIKTDKVGIEVWSGWIVDVINEEFILEWVSVISYNKLELLFTNPLDNSEEAIREFKITNKVDVFDSFEVVSSEINLDNNSIIELTLDRNLEIGVEYEIIIVAINSIDWKNIESWIDNTEVFTVGKIEEEVEFNSASNEEWWLAWTNIDSSEVENTTLGAATLQEELPKTGPEHIFLLIISIILWAWVFVFKFRKV